MVKFPKLQTIAEKIEKPPDFQLAKLEGLKTLLKNQSEIIRLLREIKEELIRHNNIDHLCNNKEK